MLSLTELKKKYESGKLRVLIVGAGALANFVVLGLADLKKIGSVIIIDKDEIEETNLNRQILYFGAVGKKKAAVMVERFKTLNGQNKYGVIIDFVTDKSKNLFRWYNKPDIMIDCLDNFKARATLNDFAIQYGIPLISGGTSPFEGQVITYIPGQTKCLECEININKLAKKREAERRGCTEVPEGSVVTTNQIIGGLMAAEVKRLLIDGEVMHGTLKYISKNPIRIGLIKGNGPCRCYKIQKPFINRLVWWRKQ